MFFREGLTATVNYLTGANIDQDEGGGGGQGRPANGAEDPVQHSQVAQDLSTIARVLENAAVSANLDPALGDTPQVDIPTPNLDIDNAPVPGASHPDGFGDASRNTDQFAPRAGGGGRAGVSGALRVTFPTEVLSKLAQEATLSKQFEGANQHLAVMRTFIANDMFPALNTQLTEMASTLDGIRIATERVADQPIVSQLRAAGVLLPQTPEERSDSFLPEVLTQGGINQLQNLETVDRNLTTGEGEDAELLDKGLPTALVALHETVSTLATEATLASMGETLTQVQSATARMAETPLADVVSQLGESFLAGFENVNQTLTLLQSAQSLAAPAPNLADIPGSSEGNPMYMHMVNQREVQDVRLVGGKIESVGSVGEIRKDVNVKHVGALAVTQGGELVVQASVRVNDTGIRAGRTAASEPVTGRYFDTRRTD